MPRMRICLWIGRLVCSDSGQGNECTGPVRIFAPSPNGRRISFSPARQMGNCLFVSEFTDNPFHEQNATRDGGNLYQRNGNRCCNQRSNLFLWHCGINGHNIFSSPHVHDQRNSENAKDDSPRFLFLVFPNAHPAPLKAFLLFLILLPSRPHRRGSPDP